MSDPFADKTPKTPYRMLWSGQWRPVLEMYDANNIPTTLPVRAAKVVLFAWAADGEGQMVVTSCGPADVLTNHDHVTQDWEMVH